MFNSKYNKKKFSLDFSVGKIPKTYNYYENFAGKQRLMNLITFNKEYENNKLEEVEVRNLSNQKYPFNFILNRKINKIEQPLFSVSQDFVLNKPSNLEEEHVNKLLLKKSKATLYKIKLPDYSVNRKITD